MKGMMDKMKAVPGKLMMPSNMGGMMNKSMGMTTMPITEKAKKHK